MKVRIEKEMVELLNPINNEKVVINKEIGGTLTSLKLAHAGNLHELIAIPYSQEYPLQNNPFYPSGLLMPWVNRVRNGNYSFLGKNYQLPINEENLGNAIHGFMARKTMTVAQVFESKEKASVTLEYRYSGDFEGYPFPFIGSLEYSLDATGNFELTIACKNIGETNMPFACGWHPYFQLGNLDDLTVYFNAQEKYLSDSQMIPLKAVQMDASKGMSLKSEKPDNVFLLKKEQNNSVVLTNWSQKIQMNLTFDATLFPYFVAFCPANESCIALEPMTGNTDCFNTFEGLISLAPQENFAGKVQINLIKIGQNLSLD